MCFPQLASAMRDPLVSLTAMTGSIVAEIDEEITEAEPLRTNSDQLRDAFQAVDDCVWLPARMNTASRFSPRFFFIVGEIRHKLIVR